jgi:anti-sigma factor RsiW
MTCAETAPLCAERLCHGRGALNRASGEPLHRHHSNGSGPARACRRDVGACRSLQGDHLTDVQTSDQHAVKPWFNGKIDIAPPVVDLTARGFTLLRGRLDYIDGKAIASIVYRRRVHVINLFVAQGAASEGYGAKLETMQGFNIERWSAQGLEFFAISDINAEELQEFVEKFENALHSGSET